MEKIATVMKLNDKTQKFERAPIIRPNLTTSTQVPDAFNRRRYQLYTYDYELGVAELAPEIIQILFDQDEIPSSIHLDLDDHEAIIKAQSLESIIENQLKDLKTRLEFLLKFGFENLSDDLQIEVINLLVGTCYYPTTLKSNWGASMIHAMRSQIVNNIGKNSEIRSIFVPFNHLVVSNSATCAITSKFINRQFLDYGIVASAISLSPDSSEMAKLGTWHNYTHLPLKDNIFIVDATWQQMIQNNTNRHLLPPVLVIKVNLNNLQSSLEDVEQYLESCGMSQDKIKFFYSNPDHFSCYITP
jgi:hypothetical protein